MHDVWRLPKTTYLNVFTTINKNTVMEQNYKTSPFFFKYLRYFSIFWIIYTYMHIYMHIYTSWFRIPLCRRVFWQWGWIVTNCFCLLNFYNYFTEIYGFFFNLRWYTFFYSWDQYHKLHLRNYTTTNNKLL